MAVVNRIADMHDEIAGWRRHIHANPEIAFEEQATSDFVAEKLAEFGIEVHRGIARTGVVGVLEGQRDNGRRIGLRADMDALLIQEATGLDYESRNPGKMHACGHDGHTAMLLGAAKYLAETRNFAGRVHFVFQPAEENEGGARVMLDEGLLEQFPCETLWGMHNMPGLPVGKIAIRPGPSMAAFDIFEIIVTGEGAHAAMPHKGADVIVAASQMVSSLQTVASRRADPVETLVVSVTQFHAGDTWNVLPEKAVLRGTVRTFNPELRSMAEAEMRRVVEGVAAAHAVSADLMYDRRYPVLVNAAGETDFALTVAEQVVGADNVDADPAPLMGGEDFAYMLEERPGCYIWVGNGASGEKGGVPVHNPRYDFNDEAAVIGASYWARLVETALPKGG